MRACIIQLSSILFGDIMVHTIEQDHIPRLGMVSLKNISALGSATNRGCKGYLTKSPQVLVSAVGRDGMKQVISALDLQVSFWLRLRKS